MRHGIAADLGEGGVLKDADRPLTLEGRAKLKLAAQGLRELGVKFNVIFTSPLLRARQTAEVVAEILDLPHKVKILDSLAPGRQCSARKRAGVRQCARQASFHGES